MLDIQSTALYLDSISKIPLEKREEAYQILLKIPGFNARLLIAINEYIKIRNLRGNLKDLVMPETEQ